MNRSRRVQVTLPWSLWELVTELADLTGTPRSSIIAELLVEVRPALETTIDALKLIKDRPLEAQRLMANFTAENIGYVMQQQLELNDAIDGRTVEGRKQRRRGNAGAAK